MAKIKVGLINCDMHGLYYAGLMAKHDLIALRDDPVIPRGNAVHLYFYTSYSYPQKIMVPTAGGFTFAKVWDKNPEPAQTFSEIWDDHPKVCKSFQEVSDGVDLVFIADCMGDGSDHLKLATPGLKKGVPTFVDKPFAYDIKDAKALTRLADKHGAPVMSLSILREVPQLSRFRNRFGELGAPEFGIVKGGGTLMAGHIHAISLAQHLFGDGVEAVECMGQSPLAYVHLDYGDKANRPSKGVVLNCASGESPHCAMYASAYGRLGAVHSPPIGDWVFPEGATKILQKIKKMVRTGEAQVPRNEMLECIAIATAGRIAQKEGRRVLLSEVL
jgi:predicted dehydrogenase